MNAIRRLIPSSALIILVFGFSFQEVYGFLLGKEERKPQDLPLEIQDERALDLIEKANEAREKENFGDAIELYKLVYKKYPICSYAPEAYYQIGEIHLARNDLKKAFQAYNFAIIRHPDFPKFNEVIEKQFMIGEKTMNTKSGQYFFLFKYKNYDAAIQYFENIVGNAPYSEYAPKSLMRVAFMHREQKHTAEAIDALDRLINFYTKSDIASEAYLELADTFSSLVAGPDYDQGATREAISYYRDFLILFPDSDLVTEGEEKLADMQDVHAKSKFVIGEFYFKRRSNYRAAEVFFNDAITVSPNSPTAQKAREYLNKIEALTPRIDIGEEVIVSQAENDPARLQLLDSKNVNENNQLANEEKKLLHLGLFNKKERKEENPVIIEEENPLATVEENLESSISQQEIENPVDDLAAKEDKPALFRLFNNNNNKTEDTEKNLAAKEGKKNLRFKLFNKSQDIEDNFISPQMEEIHLDSHSNEKTN